MTTLEAKTTITVEIFNRMIISAEQKLNSINLAHEVKYNGEELNKSLKYDFDQITEVLQNVIDKFYFDKYVVDSFMPLFLEDLDYCKNHNLSLLNSMKKLLKFIK